MAAFLAVFLAATNEECSYETIRTATAKDTCKFKPSMAPLTSAAASTSEQSTHHSNFVRSSSIENGWLVGGPFVGTYTSQLQRYIDSSYAPVTSKNYSEISLVNASVLNTLRLSGAYYCDTPLRVPSMFVLNAAGATVMPALNLSLVNVSRWSAMVMLDHVTLSAVLGGTFDASSLPPPPNASHGYQAISIVGYPGKNAVRHVRALSNNSEAIIGINQSPHAEVAFSDVGGSSSMLHTRCIWALATSAALIHHNHVRNCTKHSLDLDAYTHTSAAYSNLLVDHGEEGIFVEESASGNFIFNNTIRGAQKNGIGVYSNVVGPVTMNMIIGNTIIGNKHGMSAGAVGHDPKKQSLKNIFASNYLEGNGDGGHAGGGQVETRHGPTDSVHGDFWTSNEIVGDGFPYRQPLPADGEGVVIFEPEHT